MATQAEIDAAARVEAARETAQVRAGDVYPGPGPGSFRVVHPAVKDAVAGATQAMRKAADFIGRMKTTTALPNEPEVAALVKDLNDSAGALNDVVALPNTKHLGDQ